MLPDFWLYLALMMAYGSTCGVVGYLAGATAKISRYIRAISEEQDAQDTDGAPEHR
jgi:hypothetical protein